MAIYVKSFEDYTSFCFKKLEFVFPFLEGNIDTSF